MRLLCKHRHVFGKEGEGAHAFRVFGLAAVDVAATLALALAISMASGARYWIVLAALTALAIVVHRIFCVNTALNVRIFGLVVPSAEASF